MTLEEIEIQIEEYKGEQARARGRVGAVEGRVAALETEIDRRVEAALEVAADRLEDKAAKLTSSTSMRAIVTLAGAFFGSLLVAIFVEVFKRL